MTSGRPKGGGDSNQASNCDGVIGTD
jgi:hypothetical protein